MLKGPTLLFWVAISFKFKTKSERDSLTGSTLACLSCLLVYNKYTYTQLKKAITIAEIYFVKMNHFNKYCFPFIKHQKEKHRL